MIISNAGVVLIGTFLCRRELMLEVGPGVLTNYSQDFTSSHLLMRLESPLIGREEFLAKDRRSYQLVRIHGSWQGVAY